MAPAGSSWLRLAPAGSGWLRLAPAGSGWLHAPEDHRLLSSSGVVLAQKAPLNQVSTIRAQANQVVSLGYYRSSGKVFAQKVPLKQGSTMRPPANQVVSFG